MSPPVAVETPELVLVRYGELALKGGNRKPFELALVRNLRAALAPISAVRVERHRGRISVFPERRVLEVAERLRDVFGIKSVSPAWGCPSETEAIADLARAVLEDALADHPPGATIPFRVETSRADKRFPLRSMELDRLVGGRLTAAFPRLAVRLEEPELTLGIDVRPERTYVFVRRLAGPGGLPVGTLGRVLCLLSGGIDSPVAAWLAMKRGCLVHFVAFHSPPFLGEGSKGKVLDLVRVLGRYQPQSRLYVVPFTESQVAIRDKAPQGYRTVLYRRMMQRIASVLARRGKARALVTGESLGQVASQTLENLACIEDASSLPVLRPLLSYDKEETILIARRIGTYPISERPDPDCCTVFQPASPVIRGRIEECEHIEAAIDVAGLVERAVAASERIELDA